MVGRLAREPGADLDPFLTRRLRESRTLRREVEAARAWGVPRSVFLGWPDDDQAWAIALLEYEADICSGCGQPRSESMAAEHEFAYHPTALRCHGCAAVARESENWSGPTANTKGLMIGVHLERGPHG